MVTARAAPVMAAIEAAAALGHGGATLDQLLSLASITSSCADSSRYSGYGDKENRKTVLVSVLEELQMAGFIYCTGTGAYTPL